VAGTDVLVVSIDGTIGWATAVDELVAALEHAGARVARASTGPVPKVRTFALTDFVQARAARRVADRGIAEHDPRAVVYCSITASLLWSRPGAIWADTIAAENRPGRHGVWQRSVERRRVARAPLLLGWSPGTFEPLRARPGAPAIVLPPPVESSGPPGERDIAAITYTGDPGKRPLAPVLEAWQRVRREGETLVVAGPAELAPSPGIQPTGRLAPQEYRALVRRSRVLVAAPRREDFGIAPLEALADGCLLVTTPSPGPYPALDLARQLDPRLVADDLAPAIRIALDDPLSDYSRRAAELLRPYSVAEVNRTVAEQVLPRLLATA
jgi:Glycosyl transferases group 1